MKLTNKRMTIEIPVPMVGLNHYRAQMTDENDNTVIKNLSFNQFTELYCWLESTTPTIDLLITESISIKSMDYGNEKNERYITIITDRYVFRDALPLY